mmetsp:Transcript_11831/g.26881  ORF Transcript_11831/g.26881 Transcript_11831/m.26881 type:complete len:589 (-) Transcript_11831:64-1830(-)
MVAAAKASGPLPACGFSVSGSKKGGVPVALEKRPKGKKVTVISNVQGSAQSLVSALNSLLGCGGTCKQEASGQHWTVEVQGDHLERVGRALEDFGCLRGVKKEAPIKEKKKEVEVAARSYGYDKFLRRGEPDRGDKAACAADDWFARADCAKWHGPWTYCRGNCQQIDAGDVWEETLSGFHDQEEPKVQPEPFRSFAELNLVLRGLGMLAEVGRAAAVRETKFGAPSITLHQYRQSVLGPGSRLIEYDAGVPSASSQVKEPREKVTRLAAPRAFHPPSESRSSKKPAAQVQPKQGEFQCSVCGSTFGLQKTLKMHMQRSHFGEQPVFQLPAAKAPSFKPQSSPSQAQPVRVRPAGPGAGLSRKPRARVEGGGLSTSRSDEYCDYSDYDEEEQASDADVAAWPKVEEVAHQRVDHFHTDAWTGERLAITEALGLNRKQKRDFKRRYSTLRRQGLDIEEAWVCAIESVCEDEVFCSPSAPTGKSEYCTPSQGATFDSDSDEVIVATVMAETKDEAVEVAKIDGSIPCFVVSDWRPDEGAENQIGISEGCMVLVDWEQPPEEGGYWAYGHNCDDPRQRKGYFPRHCIECGG